MLVGFIPGLWQTDAVLVGFPEGASQTDAGVVGFPEGISQTDAMLVGLPEGVKAWPEVFRVRPRTARRLAGIRDDLAGCGGMGVACLEGSTIRLANGVAHG